MESAFKKIFSIEFKEKNFSTKEHEGSRRRLLLGKKMATEAQRKGERAFQQPLFSLSLCLCASVANYQIGADLTVELNRARAFVFDQTAIMTDSFIVASTSFTSLGAFEVRISKPVSVTRMSSSIRTPILKYSSGTPSVPAAM